jgi:dihydrolipoamide dehydrogenase
MDVDVAVLGGGPGGYTAAIRAAQLGARVACVEKEPELGGTCLRVGCIPTKAWVQTAQFLHQARDTFAKLGVGVSDPRLDFAHANEWKAGVVRQMTGGVASLFKANGVEWVKGAGTFRDANTIALDGGEDVTFRSAIVATGSFPIRPPIPGLESDLCVDSTGLLAQTEVPRRLVVLGGGIIGCEFASIFRTFGSEVTIVELLPRLIPLEDEDASKELARAFGKRGIALHLGKQCTRLEQQGNTLTVHFGEGETAEADLMLVAVGPTPSSRGSGSRRRASRSTRAPGSRPTSTAARACRTSTRSATAPGTGSSPTPPSARARSPPRTRAGTKRSSTTAPCRGRSTPTRRSPASG